MIIYVPAAITICPTHHCRFYDAPPSKFYDAEDNGFLSNRLSPGWPMLSGFTMANEVFTEELWGSSESTPKRSRWQRLKEWFKHQ